VSSLLLLLGIFSSNILTSNFELKYLHIEMNDTPDRRRCAR